MLRFFLICEVTKLSRLCIYAISFLLLNLFAQVAFCEVTKLVSNIQSLKPPYSRHMDGYRVPSIRLEISGGAQSEMPMPMPVPVPVLACNICNSIFPVNPVATFCGHIFCWPCLHQSWPQAGQAKLCPVCRSALWEGVNIVPVHGSDDRSMVCSRTTAPGPATSVNRAEAAIPRRPIPPAPHARVDVSRHIQPFAIPQQRNITGFRGPNPPHIYNESAARVDVSRRNQPFDIPQQRNISSNISGVRVPNPPYCYNVSPDRLRRNVAPSSAHRNRCSNPPLFSRSARIYDSAHFASNLLDMADGSDRERQAWGWPSDRQTQF